MIWLTGGLLVAGLAGICVGVYALLDGTTPRILATPVLVCAVVVGALGIGLSGRGVRRSSYRPDRWRTAELVVVASGVVAGVVVYLTSRVDPTNLNPSLYPLQWPQVSVLPMIGILAGLVPAFASPPPVDSRSVERQVEVGA